MNNPTLPVKGSCHCGAVQVTVVHHPKEVTDCRCSICFRYGALWAYYPPGGVHFHGDTQTYSWGSKNFEFHRCTACGCVVGWLPVDPNFDHWGVNARMLTDFEPDAVTVHIVESL